MKFVVDDDDDDDVHRSQWFALLWCMRSKDRIFPRMVCVCLSNESSAVAEMAVQRCICHFLLVNIEYY